MLLREIEWDFFTRRFCRPLLSNSVRCMRLTHNACSFAVHNTTSKHEIKHPRHAAHRYRTIFRKTERKGSKDGQMREHSSQASNAMRYAMKPTATGCASKQPERRPTRSRPWRNISSSSKTIACTSGCGASSRRKTADSTKGNPQDAMDSALEEASRIVEAQRKGVGEQE